MKKQRLLVASFSLLMMGLLPACSGSSGSVPDSSGYPVYEGEEHHLTYEKTEAFVSSYENGDFFSPSGLNVFFDETLLSEGQYYFITDATDPAQTVLTGDDMLSIQNKNDTFIYYVAFDQDGYTYVSESIEVEVSNPGAVDRWVYYTIMGGILVAIGVWSFIRTKAKKEGRV